MSPVVRALLVVLLCARSAAADPSTVTHANPAVRFERPEGFAPCPAGAAPADDLLDCFQRGGAGRGVVLTVVALRAIVPERALTEVEIAELRRADPFPFQDRRGRAQTLGFSVETLEGRATIPGSTQAVSRFAAAVPLDDGAVLVTVVAPSEGEPEARAVFARVLASMQGRSSWTTSAQRAGARAMQAGVALGLLGALASAAAWARRRRTPNTTPSRFERALRGASALGWLLLAAGERAVDGPEGTFPALVFASMGAALAVLALRPKR